MAWTDERIETLKKHWQAGSSASVIARMLGGVTRSAVIGKIHRLKLSGRSATVRKPRLRRVPGKVKTNVSLRAKKSKPLPPPVIIPSTPRLVSLIDLEPNDCRWPIGDPREAGFGFCGCAKHPGSSYCAEHLRVATAPPRQPMSPTDLRRFGSNMKVPQVVRLSDGANAAAEQFLKEKA